MRYYIFSVFNKLAVKGGIGNKIEMLLLVLVGVCITFILIRIIQRLYYLLCGHRNYNWDYAPREELMLFLREVRLIIDCNSRFLLLI